MAKANYLASDIAPSLAQNITDVYNAQVVLNEQGSATENVASPFVASTVEVS
jgi:hypothetical protein